MSDLKWFLFWNKMTKSNPEMIVLLFLPFHSVWWYSVSLINNYKLFFHISLQIVEDEAFTVLYSTESTQNKCRNVWICLKK